jgi:predicted RNA-binding protein Jag
MKSLVEEASSITKAIEKAWARAGKPESFSVKIFESPEVGFLGFTKKSAKVGIFFEEVTVEKTEKRPYNKERGPQRSNRPHSRPHPQRRGDDRNGRSRFNKKNDGERSDNRRSNDQRYKKTDRPQRAFDKKPHEQNTEQKQEPTEQKPTPKAQQATSPFTSGVGVKKAPKISGRRFSGNKKNRSE